MPGQVKTSPEWDLPLEQHPEARRIIRESYEAGGMRTDEIAEVMGLSETRVKDLIRYALRHVRENMGDDAKLFYQHMQEDVCPRHPANQTVLGRTRM